MMSSSSNNNILAGKSAGARKPQEPPVKCPRCDSPNTKFCYYNNYSLTQPRHFCKTCRRYWTKGGALRNVPIGGGCRKNKKTSKPSSSDAAPFFQGLTPAMDFHLGAINNAPDIDIFNHFSSPFGNLPPATGFNFPPSHKVQQDRNAPLGFQEMGSMNNYDPVAPLSSIQYQDFHWKTLQHQRLGSFLDINHKEINDNSFVQKPQPILFQNLENSNTGSFLAGTSRNGNGSGNLSTELFFNNSYATAAPPTPATSSSYNWSGSNQAWTELTQFSSLP